MTNFFSLIIKGALIGIANIIPGVSGGTMAFVLGIYQQLSEAIGYFFLRPNKRKEYFIFLCQLFIGVVIGFILFSKLISFLLGIDLPSDQALPFSYVPTFGFFLGLIIGSIPILISLQQDTKISPIRVLLSVLAFILLFVIASLKSTETIIESQNIIKDYGLFKIHNISFHRALWLIFVGGLAAATMVIPGISGSALLVALGEYAPILNAISERAIIPLGFIGIGAVLGIILTTLLMAKLLEKKSGATFFFILGLIFASCAQIVLQMINAHASLIAWGVSVITTSLGIWIALQSEKLKPK